MLEPLAERLAHPERLVGLHFFNPVAQMPLVEIVSAERTEPAMAQAAIVFTRKLDKLPVPCRSAPGFVVNRVLMPYLHEAMYAAQEGMPLALIDKAAEDFGMPMGPIELADVVGLDVANHVGRDHRRRARSARRRSSASSSSSSARSGWAARAAPASTSGRTARRSSQRRRALRCPTISSTA